MSVLPPTLLSRRALLTAGSTLALSSLLPVSAADNAAEALLEAGHFKRARTLLAPQVKANPNDALAAHQLSRVYLTFDQAEPTISLAEKSIQLEPNNDRFHTHLAHVYGWLSGIPPALRQYAYVRLLKKELDTVLSLNPKQIDGLLIKAVFLYIAPGMVGGDKKQAEQVVAQMVQLNPERGYLADARLGLKSKNYSRAEAAYQKALATNSHSYDARFGLGNLYSALLPTKRLDAAEQQGRALVQEQPGRIGGYQVLAQTYADGQRWSDLDAVLAQSDKAVPDNRAPYFFAAERLADSGADLARAERYLHQYQQQEREGDGPTPAETHYTLGLTYEKWNKKPEAKQAFQAALHDKPNFDLAKKALQRVS